MIKEVHKKCHYMVECVFKKFVHHLLNGISIKCDDVLETDSGGFIISSILSNTTTDPGCREERNLSRTTAKSALEHT